MKTEICEAFCKGLSVSEMKNGFAISTLYDDLKGDPLGFYALGPDDDGFYRIVDDGMTVPFLEAAGASLDTETRLFLFNDILSSCGAHYSDSERQIYLAGVNRDGLANASIKFVALLLRVQDLLLITRERVESTFRDDVLEKLRERFEKETAFREQEPVSEQMADVIPDVVIQANQKEPVAVFIATSSQKISEAVYLHMAAMYQHQMPLRVVAILQNETPAIPFKLRQRADNYLDAVPRYEGEARATIDRVAREVFGRDALMGAKH
jgi:hypothetical protein